MVRRVVWLGLALVWGGCDGGTSQAPPVESWDADVPGTEDDVGAEAGDGGPEVVPLRDL